MIIQQGRIQEFALGGRPLCLRSRVSLKPARGLGERCKLRQRGLGRSPGRKRIWCTLKPLVAIILSILKYMFYSCHLSWVPWRRRSVASSAPSKSATAQFVICLQAPEARNVYTWMTMGNSSNTVSIMHDKATGPNHDIKHTGHIVRPTAVW